MINKSVSIPPARVTVLFEKYIRSRRCVDEMKASISSSRSSMRHVSFQRDTCRV